MELFVSKKIFYIRVNIEKANQILNFLLISSNAPNFDSKKACKIRLVLIFFSFETLRQRWILKKITEHYKVSKIFSCGRVVLL